MDKKHFAKAAILMTVIVLAAVISWELYLRNKGYKISYDDGPALWADKRDKVYEKNATVFIGSSRIKYDLDIVTWRKLTGEDAVQLAMQGTSPRPILTNLANDKNFTGRLLIDVTEILFFGASPGRQAEVTANLNFYKDNHTPAQRASFVLNKELESNLVFLDKDNFSASAMLDKLSIPNRQGVFTMPLFPLEFNQETFDRQSYMTPEFVADTLLQNKVKGIWQILSSRRDPPMNADAMDMIFASVKSDIDKIKQRGGTVLFLRTPSSGPFLKGESMVFPRDQYWARLLKYTDCRGIHFMDYPVTANFQCPEFSHLSPNDAIVYTQELVRILATDMNWFSGEKYTAKVQ